MGNTTKTRVLSEEVIEEMDAAIRLVQSDKCPKWRCGRIMARRFLPQGEGLMCPRDGYSISLQERRAVVMLLAPVLIPRLQVFENGHHLR